MSFPNSIRRNSLELLQYAKRLQERYILHPCWSNSSEGKITKLNQVPDVDIAEAGCCKYILIEVQDEGAMFNQTKLVVRGDASCVDHLEILEKLKEQVDETKVKLTCKGGGRIQVDPATRTILVYGYSPEFGAADHEETAEILRRHYYQWTIEITDDDY